MWTETTEGRKFVQEISKSLVIQIAPEELDLFDELVEEYFQDPTPPNVSSSTPDDPLGFGSAETLVAITPAMSCPCLPRQGQFENCSGSIQEFLPNTRVSPRKCQRDVDHGLLLHPLGSAKSSQAYET